MGLIIRESLKNSIVNYVGVVIGTINVLFLYNKLLTTEEFGLYSILLSFPLVAASFINLGIPHVCVRFFNRFADADKKYHGLFTLLLVSPIIGAGFFFVLFYGFKTWFDNLYKESPFLSEYSWTIPILTFFVIYQHVLEAYCRSHLKVFIPTIIREIYLKLSNTLLVVLYYFNLISFDGVATGLIFVFLGAVIILLFYVKHLNRFYLVWDWSILKSPLFPEMIKYGLWTTAGGAAATSLPHLEKFILAMFENGLTHTAIFTLALNIALVITIPRNTIAYISDPLLAKASAEGNLKDVATIYSKSALNLSIIGLFLFLGVWVNIDSIFEIIPNSDKFSSGKYVVLLIGLANVFDMATGLNSEILRNSPYYKVDFVAFIIRFIVLTIANLVLIPIYSFNGAAMAILVSTVLYNLAKYAFIWHKMKIQPFSINSLKVVILAAVAYLLAEGIHWDANNELLQNILKILVKGSIIVIVFGGGVLALTLSPDLNNTIKQLYRKIKS